MVELWALGDAVGRGTLLCLALMLIGAGYVLAHRWRALERFARDARALDTGFWRAPNLYEAVRDLEQDNAFRAIAEGGLEAAARREGRLTDRIAASEWIAIALQRSIGGLDAELRRGLGFLEAVGIAAPFIGLFGTIWMIHRTLTDASAEPLATSIGSALLATAVGLAIAVLALLGSAWVVRRNEVAIAAARDFARRLHAILVGAEAIARAAVA